MRGSYKSYSPEVRSAIIRSGNPDLFPELAIPRATARHWIKHGVKSPSRLPVQSRREAGLENILRSLTIVLRTLRHSDVSLDGVSSEDLSVLKISLKERHITKYLPRRTINLLQNSVFLCPVAMDGICIRRYPTRIKQSELKKMRDYYESPDFGYMSVNSLALKARRDGVVSANVTTWYRYARRLSWRRPLQKIPKRNHRGVGITAKKPHQVWHVDVTEIPSDDGDKSFLSTILDNRSRAVLRWHLDDHKSQEISAALLQESLRKYKKHKRSALELISDGGSENSIFKQITDGVRIRHKIAGKEIGHPNSMIESFFRSMKSDFLSRIELPDRASIRAAVEFYIHHHNHVIPRKCLNGLTPTEVLNGANVSAPEIEGRFVPDRIPINRGIECPVCWIE